MDLELTGFDFSEIDELLARAALEADEQFPLQPSSPYSAGKAGSDLLALSYHKTYKLPVIVTRASNNYGPYQFPEKPSSLIEYVTDRPGHDRRYALSSEKLTRETAWRPEMDFERGLKATVDWYRSNPEWIAHVRSGEYQSYHDKNYANRNRELREISTS